MSMQDKISIKKDTLVYSLVNCSILTMDADENYYPTGTIVIENDRIAEIGPVDKITPRGVVYDFNQKIVLPGLINTHTHSASPLFKGMADDLSLMDWLKKVLWPAEKNLTSEIAYWGSSYSCLEFLEAGITTFADQYFFSESIGRAVQNSGLRGFIAPTVFTNGSPETQDTIEAAMNFIEKYKGKEDQTLIYPCIGPHAPYSCNSETLKTVAKIAASYNLIIHTHISETVDENREIFEKTGLTPTQYLDSVGILEERVLAAHCIHVNQKDMELFRQKNVRVSYNPVSNLKLVSGIMPMKELMDHEVLISLGTDGAQSNNSLDLLKDLKTGVLIQKQQYQDATFIPAKEALKMITINGAKALDMDHEIGSLEKGKKADIIALDTKKTNINPIHLNHVDNIYSAIVYASDASNVSDVIVNGKILMQDKEHLHLNKDEILNETRKGAKIVLEKAGLL